MSKIVKTLPTIFTERKVAGPSVEFRYLSDDEVRLFTHCNTDKKVLELAKKYTPLFGNHRVTDDEAISTNDIRDFCAILADALKIRTVADGKMDCSALDVLNGNYAYDEEKGIHTYGIALFDSADYWSMLQDGCKRLGFFSHGPTAVTLTDADIEPRNLFMAHGESLEEVFSVILGVHMVDICRMWLDGHLIDVAGSLASSIWNTIAETLQAGQIRICQYRNCRQPFIVADERGVKRGYCCDSHKQMEWRKRKAEKANPAR